MNSIQQTLVKLRDNCSSQTVAQQTPPNTRNAPYRRRLDKSNGTKQALKSDPQQQVKIQNSYLRTECFRCDQPGHFVCDCPFPVVTGHMQMAVQPHSVLTTENNPQFAMAPKPIQNPTEAATKLN